MKLAKLALGISLASLSIFSFSSDSFAESVSTVEPYQVTSTSSVEITNRINPNADIYELTVEPQSITIQATSASFSLQNFAKGSGEFKSSNSISWDSNNKTITLTVRQYEIVSSSPSSVVTTDAHIIYDLESSSGNRAGAKQLDGLYDGSNTGTVTWTNVKPGTYNLIIKNNGTRYANASGTFAAQ